MNLSFFKNVRRLDLLEVFRFNVVGLFEEIESGNRLE